MMPTYLWDARPFHGDGAEIFELFKHEPQVFFLDSSLSRPAGRRYSFIGFSPFTTFSGEDSEALASLQKEYRRYSHPGPRGRSVLGAGLVGYLGYDLGLSLENIAITPKEGLPIPGFWFGFYDTVITLDHFSRKLYVLSTGLPEKTDRLRRIKARSRIADVLARLARGRLDGERERRGHFCREQSAKGIPLSSNFRKEDYLRAVRRALEHIRRGDIYQINLSQRFSADLRGFSGRFDPAGLYLLLRRISPSGFGAYLDGGGFQVMSSSPERFLRLRGRAAETRPMKGTRPRGKNKRDDERQRQELWTSPKEKAELLMITDLERNDLGRVCDYGTIQVKKIRTIEKYRTVFQATSTVSGKLAKGKDCFDLLRACFPGGSVTGCPKIRAMQIIEELEPTRRSIYTGALGYISFSGEMDFNILIRTMLACKNQIWFDVGGGIVSDSVPEKEYEETLVKAAAIKDCLAEFFSARPKSLNPRRRGPAH